MEALMKGNMDGNILEKQAQKEGNMIQFGK
jgi:hypothetical protein